MQTLNVFTTATPRPELHNNTVIKAIKDLFNSNIEKITWYINVDCPSMFSEEDRKNTVDNFLSFYKTGLKTIIWADHSSAHFGAAARRLYTQCDIEGKNNIFLWLEDDWVLNSDQYFFDLLDHYYISDLNFFLCSIAQYVTGNPFFFKQDFFELVKNKYLSTEKNIDPELMLFSAVCEKFNIQNPRVIPPNSIHRQYFFDVGRQWRAEKNIQKLDKYVTHLKEVTWST